MKNRELETEELTPPGERINGKLKARGWSRRRLSAALGLSHSYTSFLINGRRAITPLIALELERVLGGPARDWLYDQADYDLELARRHQLRRESQASKENS